VGARTCSGYGTIIIKITVAFDGAPPKKKKIVRYVTAGNLNSMAVLFCLWVTKAQTTFHPYLEV
jgi:hypothetical protein